MNRTITDFLEFPKIVDTFRRLAKVFPEDGHEPDGCGFDLHPEITGTRLDNDGCPDNKILHLQTDEEKFDIPLTDLVALAVHGFKCIDTVKKK